MLIVAEGIVRDGRVKVVLIPAIAHGPLRSINAIIVHQTGSATAAGTLAGYRTEAKGTGTHFLIDRDGTMYQTVALNQKCWHIGKLQVRCLQEHRCSPSDQKRYESYKQTHSFYARSSQDEMKKDYPDMYPSNSDAIGIELVGVPTGPETYQTITSEQQRSLDWLIPQLLDTLHLKRTDVYRHPVVSYKNPGEAASANF